MDYDERMGDYWSDIDNLREEMAETESRYRRMLWMLIISSGGEIRIPPSVQRDVNDPGDLVQTIDSATGDMVFTATLYAPGVRRL